MIRIVLSIIIVTLLITYAILPFLRYINKFISLEAKRIDRSLNLKNKIEKDDLEL